MTIEQGWDEANDHQDDDPSAVPAGPMSLAQFADAVDRDGGLTAAWDGYRVAPEQIPDGALRELWREAQALSTLAEAVHDRMERITKAFGPFFAADAEAFAAWSAGTPVEGTDPGPARPWSHYLPGEATHPGFGPAYIHTRPVGPEHEHHFPVTELAGGDVDFGDCVCGTTFDEDQAEQHEQMARELASEARRA